MNDDERRKEIKDLILNVGVFNLPKQALAEKYGVNEQMIEQDIVFLVAHEDYNAEEKIFDYAVSQSVRNALKHSERILIDKDTKKRDKLEAAKAISFIAEKMARIQETKQKNKDLRKQTVLTDL